MKKALISILKVVVPIALGVYLVWYLYNSLDETQRQELFDAFKRADYLWIGLSVLMGLLSHISRAIRWRYLLEPLGHRPTIANAYHSVMIGYIINLALPRAGEASRAGFLQRYEKVPFNQGFGTILAERAIDLGMLVIIGLVGLALQYDKLDIIISKINQFASGNQPQVTGDTGGSSTGYIILGIVALVGIIGAILYFKNPKIKEKVNNLIKGFVDGVKSIFKTKKRGLFVVHTLFIWMMYLGMTAISFLALEETSDVGLGGFLAVFIAGSIGIIVVQGGIGIYPALVGIVVTIYIAPEGTDLIHPSALALGWILWSSQTVLIIVLGGISLFLMPYTNRHIDTGGQ